MFIASQQRKTYTPKYRREAAKLVIETPRPIARVDEEIGVTPGLLGKWAKSKRERQCAGDGMSEADLRADNARLRREFAETKIAPHSVRPGLRHLSPQTPTSRKAK